MEVKKVYLVLFLILLNTVVGFGQNQDLNWYFGQTNYGLVFDKNSKAVSLTTTKHLPYSYCGTFVASDASSGNLMFYSDGTKVIDQSHNVMPNGSGLNGYFATNQSVTAVPFPGDCNKYYMFTNNQEIILSANGNVYYSIIDLSLPGNGTILNPLGDVIPSAKNILLTGGGTEAMTVLNGDINGKYWLFIPQKNSTLIKVYLINSSGVNFSHTINTGIPFDHMSIVKYNDVNQKVVFASYIENGPLVIANFNKSTGQTSNYFQVTGVPFGTDNSVGYGIHSVEWSPDNSKLYISKYRMTSSGGRLYQYNLATPLIPPVAIFTLPSGQVSLGLKLGPDGRIYHNYFSSSSSQNYIGIINSPNNLGLLCNYNDKGLAMPVNIANAIFFPDFLISSHSVSNLKPVAQIDILTTCIGEGVNSTIDVMLNDSDPNGDQLTVSVISVQHGSASIVNDKISYTSSFGYFGNDTIYYSVCDNGCSSLCDTSFAVLCIDKCLSLSPISALNDLQKTCILNNTNSIVDVLPNDIIPPGELVSVSVLSTTYGSSSVVGNKIIYTPLMGFNGSDTVFYRVCSNDCSSWCDDAYVTVCVLCTNSGTVSAVNDTIKPCIEVGNSIIIKPLLNDIYSGSVSVLFQGLNTNPNFELLNSDSIRYSAPYLYNGSDTISYIICDNNCHGACDTASVVVCVKDLIFFIPNLITVNDDSKNDHFEILGLYPNTSIEVFNRWGELLYASDNYKNEWPINRVSDGIYYYHLNDSIREKSWKGWLEVISKYK